MKYIYAIILILFSINLNAESIKLKESILVGGMEKGKVSLLDLTNPHKINQSLVPVLEGIELVSVNKYQELTLSRKNLISHLKKIKLENPKLKNTRFVIPKELKVKHLGYKLDIALLSQILKRSWAKKCSSCRFVIENLSFPEIERKFENKNWFLKMPQSLPRGRFTAQLIFPQVQAPATVWLTGQAMAQKPVVVVNRNVSKGQKIDLNDVQLSFKNIGLVQDAIVDLDVLKNKVSSKYLMNGDIIKTRYLASRVLFNRGDAVKILFKGDNLSVSSSGVAEALGKVGHRVWVKSLSTKKRISGLVLDTGEVLIQ